MTQTPMQFVYTLIEGGELYRAEGTPEEIDLILETGAYLDQLLAFLRWPNGNFDFVLDRPRVFHPEDDTFARVYQFAAPVTAPTPPAPATTEVEPGPEAPPPPETPDSRSLAAEEPEPPRVEGGDA